MASKHIPGRLKGAAFLSAQHPRLKALIQSVGSPKLTFEPGRGIFQALSTAITYQQLHGKAAETILNRFLALFPGQAFPEPHAVLKHDVEALMRCGLSRAKASAILDLAAKTHAGLVPPRATAERMTNDELIAALTEVKGIGRWTVEMFLMFTLGRPDILPVHDYGVRVGYSLVFRKKKLPSPKELEKIGARYAPHRTVLAWYLWRACDLEKDRKKAKAPPPPIFLRSSPRKSPARRSRSARTARPGRKKSSS